MPSSCPNPTPIHPSVLIPDPEWSHDESDWQNKPLPLPELQRLGRIMRALLDDVETDPNGNGTARANAVANRDTSAEAPMFRFPFIYRRVETLNILSELSEHRRLSLDIDQHMLRRRLRRGILGAQAHQPNPSTVPLANVHDYGDYAPIPFAIFRKGILHEFNAFDEDKQPLSLVGKRICLQMGLAWLLNVLPWDAHDWSESTLLHNGATDLTDVFVQHLWHIIQYVPRGSELRSLADLDELESPLRLADPPEFIPPPCWAFTLTPGHPRTTARQVLALLLELAGIADPPAGVGRPEQPGWTRFGRRLRFLTVNYLPLLLVPWPQEDAPHRIVKVEWLYERPAEEWMKDHSLPARWNDPEVVRRNWMLPGFIRDEGSDAEVIMNKPKIHRPWGWVRHWFLPHGPWPYHIAFFGDLEGHCEHLNLKAPDGVEFVSGCFLPGGNLWPQGRRYSCWPKRRAGMPYAELGRSLWQRQFPRLKTDVARLYKPAVDQLPTTASNDPVPDELRSRLALETSYKLQRDIISIKRHEPVPGGRLTVRLSIAPSMSGLFLPAAVSLALVLLLHVLMLVLYRVTPWSPLQEPPDSSSLQFFPLISPLIAAAGSIIVNLRQTSLRAMMLRQTLQRVNFGLIAGSTMLFIYAFVVSFVGSANWKHGNASAMTTFLLQTGLWFSTLVVAYALVYLVWGRLRLSVARHKLDEYIGHTEPLMCDQTD